MNKKVEITDIKTFVANRKMQGYIWYINEKLPQIFNNEIINFNDTSEAKNQIQEAYLTNEEKNLSIRIVNSDGAEHCFIYKQSYFTNNYKIDKKPTSYPSHIKNIKFLHFKQAYKCTESLSGNHFKTWQPIMQFFTGLTLNK